MKMKVLYTLCLFVFLSFVSSVASAELSILSKWRIEQAVERCNKNDHALLYTDYWQDSVTEENRETVCIAEQFVRQVVAEGDAWMETKAMVFIRECRAKAGKNDKKYYACLTTGVKQIIKQLSFPCRELATEGLWEKDRCENLLSFMFAREFERVMEANKPFIKKMMDIRLLARLFNPVAAIIALVLFVLNMVVLVDRGSWTRIPKFVLIVGAIILASFFLEEEYRFLGSGVAVILSVAAIVWSYLRPFIEKRKEQKRQKELEKKKEQEKWIIE